MAIVVEDACRHGLADVNLVTSAAWHATWRPLPLPAYDVVAFRRPWRAAAYKAYRFSRRAARKLVRRDPRG
jgi:hypothetical protein